MTTHPDQIAVKPLYGAACNGCGLCCLLEQCPLSEVFFGFQDRCPALEKDAAGKLVCGLIVHPRAYLKEGLFSYDTMASGFSVMLGAGTGCDGVANDEDRAIADTPEGKSKLLDAVQASYDATDPRVRLFIDWISTATG